MDLHLNNKRVLITGSSRGIGYGMANAFLDEGARVILLDWENNRLTQSVEKLYGIYGTDRLLAFTTDCADALEWTKVIDEIDIAWGGLDVVIANVGDGRGPQDALPKADRFAAAWRSNFTTSEETARATLPLLNVSGGCLLFISSIAGLEAIGAPTDYSVAKSAIIALTKQMARRLAPTVRVNCIAPGNIFFPDGSWDEKIKNDPQRVESIIKSTVPMKRFGTPSEIAGAALFLCSERAAFITGSCLVVDGGQTVGIF